MLKFPVTGCQVDCLLSHALPYVQLDYVNCTGDFVIVSTDVLVGQCCFS